MFLDSIKNQNSLNPSFSKSP